MTFILSAGRHEEYFNPFAWGLNLSGTIKSFLSGKILKQNLAVPDVILSSPLQRAQATSLFRAVGLGVDLEKIILAPELVENATAEQINMFLLGLREEAKINHWQHVHLVTHLPILGLICQQRLSLPMGDVLVFECDDSSKIKLINQLHIEAMIEVPKYQQLANKLNKVKLKSSEDVLGVLLSCDEL